MPQIVDHSNASDALSACAASIAAFNAEQDIADEAFRQYRQSQNDKALQIIIRHDADVRRANANDLLKAWGEISMQRPMSLSLVEQ